MTVADPYGPVEEEPVSPRVSEQFSPFGPYNYLHDAECCMMCLCLVPRQHRARHFRKAHPDFPAEVTP